MSKIILAFALLVSGLGTAHALGPIPPHRVSPQEFYKARLKGQTGTPVKVSTAHNSQYYKVLHLKPGSYQRIKLGTKAGVTTTAYIPNSGTGFKPFSAYILKTGKGRPTVGRTSVPQIEFGPFVPR